MEGVTGTLGEADTDTLGEAVGALPLDTTAGLDEGFDVGGSDVGAPPVQPSAVVEIKAAAAANTLRAEFMSTPTSVLRRIVAGIGTELAAFVTVSEGKLPVPGVWRR